jgi:hypothetical protein
MKRSSVEHEKKFDEDVGDFRARRVREETDAAARRTEAATAASRKQAASLATLIEKLDVSAYISLEDAEVTMPSSVPIGARFLHSSPNRPPPPPHRCSPPARRIRSQRLAY